MTAAPGPQQSDEVVSRDDALVFLSTLYGRGHAYPRPGQTRQEMSEESVALVRRFVADHTPAAPSAQPDEVVVVEMGSKLHGPFASDQEADWWASDRVGNGNGSWTARLIQPVRDTEEGRR